MKKLIYLLFALIFIVSCSNDFELTEEWKDIPVVYGVLSKADTAHYIRIERAFLDPNTSALEQAKIADSIYYQNADVKLIHVSSGNEFSLEQVDGRDEGYFREDGVFAQEPNFLFKIHSSEIQLVGGDDYRLELDRNNGNPLVTAQTVVLNDLVLFRPLSGTNLRFDDNLFFTVSWREIPDAAFYDVSMIFHYNAQDPSNPNAPFIQKEIFWEVAKNIRDSEFRFLGDEFYAKLAAGVDASINVPRNFLGVTVIVDAGGQSLFDYIQVGAANSGLTGSQELPDFTNLSEGLGIFSSRNSIQTERFQVATSTRDSIRTGRFTREFNFN